MLPVGVSQRGRTVLVRTTLPAPAGLTPTQSAVLERVAEAEGTWAEISEGLSKATQRDDLEPLIDAGLVSREVAFLTPPPHPKFARRVRLLADPTTITRVLPTLGHSSKQADALAWLVRQPDPLPTLKDLCAGAGCEETSVRALAERGWVSIVPRRASIRRLSPERELSGGGGKAPASARLAAALAVLPTELVDEAEFRASQGVDSATLLRSD